MVKGMTRQGSLARSPWITDLGYPPNHSAVIGMIAR